MSNDARPVWVITSGSYSDYRVECVFEREQDAIAYLHLKGYTLTPSKIPSCPWDGERPGEYGTEDVCIETYQYWPAGVVPHVDANDIPKPAPPSGYAA